MGDVPILAKMFSISPFCSLSMASHHSLERKVFCTYSHKLGYFPGGEVNKNLPANAGDMGSIPGSGKIPHTVEQLSLGATTAEAHIPRACVPRQEKPPK